jgi:hypothetical protein
MSTLNHGLELILMCKLLVKSTKDGSKGKKVKNQIQNLLYFRAI